MHQWSSKNKDQGSDQPLRQWSWILPQGRNSQRMRFVSAYRPVRNRQDSGSTWNQHFRYLRSIHRLDDPIECFDKNLCAQLEQWLALGDHLILGMDMNEDTRTSTLGSSLQRLGLQNRVLTEHPNLVPPSTFQRNTNNQPIDAIWTTSLVWVRQTGILSFDHTILADHRCLWMDVDIDIFGIQPPRKLLPVTRRLQANDPRQVAKYCSIVEHVYHKQKIPSQCRELWNRQPPRSTNSLARTQFIADFNEIHRKTRAIRSSAEKSIRKIKRGGVPWSPQIQLLRDKIEVWQRALKIAKQLPTNRRRFKTLISSTGETQALNYDPETALTRVKQCWKDYHNAKPGALTTRNHHLQQLAQAKADANDTDTAAELTKLMTTESQRRLGRAARRIRDTGSKEPVYRVTAKTTTGVEECTTPETIAFACAHSNLQRQLKATASPFFQPPLLSLFGYQGFSPATEQPPGLDRYTLEFIQASKCPDNISADLPISLLVTPTDQRQAWSTQDERTASEPTTLSFSHYKAAGASDILTEVDVTLR